MFESKPCSKNFKGKDNKIKPPKKITERYLYNSGLYYLQRFTASTAHFKFVMTRKIDKSCKFHLKQDRDECLEMLDKVTEEFVKSGYLNDEAYAKGTVFSLRRKGLSKNMILMKLSQKGIEKDLTLTMLDLFADENSDADGHDNNNKEQNEELKAALRLIKRKKIAAYYKEHYEQLDKETQQALYKKWLGTLGRAGFDFQTSKKALGMNIDDIHHINEFEY